MARKKRSSSHREKRKLRLQIRGLAPGATPEEFWGVLRQSIRRGDYELPDGWDVRIRWRNRTDKPMKSDEFSNAMQESADSSRGWDGAVVAYINRQISRLKEPRTVPSKLAARTKRVKRAARSGAGRKAWRTRKAEFRRRSKAALKGWVTRRARA